VSTTSKQKTFFIVFGGYIMAQESYSYMVGHSRLSQTTTITNSQEKTQNLKAKNSRFEEYPPLV
jgi:hypothetical protein